MSVNCRIEPVCVGIECYVDKASDDHSNERRRTRHGGNG